MKTIAFREEEGKDGAHSLSKAEESRVPTSLHPREGSNRSLSLEPVLEDQQMNLFHIESGGYSRAASVLGSVAGDLAEFFWPEPFLASVYPFGLMDAASLVLKARYQGGSPSGTGEVAYLGTNPLLPRGKLRVCELPPDSWLPQPHDGVRFVVRLGSSLLYPFHTHMAFFSFA